MHECWPSIYIGLGWTNVTSMACKSTLNFPWWANVPCCIEAPCCNDVPYCTKDSCCTKDSPRLVPLRPCSDLYFIFFVTGHGSFKIDSIKIHVSISCGTVNNPFAMNNMVREGRTMDLSMWPYPWIVPRWCSSDMLTHFLETMTANLQVCL